MQALVADLTVFSLSSLLQAAESDQATGAFRFEPEGTLVLRDGKLVHATYRAMQGIDAALTLLLTTSTRMVFEPLDVDEAAPLIEMMALVIDGSRLSDDWVALAPQVLALREGSTLDDLHETPQRVVRLLDGSRIVHEAIELAGVDVITVIDDLIDLREAGSLVEVAPPRPERVPQPGAPLPASTPAAASEDRFDDLVDASRVALRAKAYERAIEFLEQASAVRPENRTVLQNIRRIQQMTADNS